MSTPLIDQKRAYLKAAVETLKGRGLTQRVVAERMEESEGALSGRIGGQRGIPDDYIDRFSAEFKIPYAFGQGIPAGGGMTAEQAEELISQGKTTARLLNLVLDRVEGTPAKQ